MSGVAKPAASSLAAADETASAPFVGSVGSHRPECTGDIVPYVYNQKTPERSSPAERQMRREALEYDRARLASMESPMTLSVPLMEQVVELDKQRRELLADDPDVLARMELLSIRSLRVRHPRRFCDHDFSIWD